jgi:hypothetical protein
MLLLGVAMLGAAALCGDGGRFTEANNGLEETLPVYPGAEQIERKAERVTERGCEEDCATIGYTTWIAYTTEATGQELVDFFIAELGDDWAYEVEEIGFARAVTAVPGGGPQAVPTAAGTGIFNVLFTRGDATISIQTPGTSWRGGSDNYGVILDAEGARR